MNPIWHIFLLHKEAMEQFAYIVGDIHGCYEPLMALEEVIYRHAEEHKAVPLIVSVGDIIDRGPQSGRVVEHFQRGVQAGTHVVVAGNHEAVLFEVLSAVCQSGENHCTPAYIVPLHAQYERDEAARNETWTAFVERKKTGWLRQGGRETLRSFGCDPEKPETWVEASEHLGFLAVLPMIWESDTTIVSHALSSADDIAYARRLCTDEIQPDRESPSHALHTWGLLWNRECPEHCIDTLRTHVSGHTPNDDVVRLGKQRRLLIDTACVYGNKLTAWCERTGDILQVAGRARGAQKGTIF